MDKSANAIDAQVGANIRSLRIRSGVSQVALGKQLGIAFQQVQKYEKGTNRISASRMVMTARALGCSVIELFDGVYESAPDEIPLAPAGQISSTSLEVIHLLETIPRKQRNAVLSLLRALAVSDMAPEDGDG